MKHKRIKYTISHSFLLEWFSCIFNQKNLSEPQSGIRIKLFLELGLDLFC